MLSKRYLLMIVVAVLLSFFICFSMCKDKGCEEVRFLPRIAQYVHGIECALIDMEGKTQVFGIRIVSFPEYKNGYIRCVGQLSVNGAKVDMFVEKENGKNPVEDFAYGDFLEIEGEISVPEHPGNVEEFDYREYQIVRGVSGNLYADTEDVHVISGNNNPLYMVKSKLIALINSSFDIKTAGIISSMLFGFKGDLDQDVKEDLSNAGLSHIIAISGIHFSCIIMFVLRLTGKNQRKRKRKNILMLGVVLAYVVLVGPSSSVIRAAFMIGGKMFALIFKREQDSLTTLSLSALVELAINPLVFLMLSFQLSYLSFLGVIFVSPMLEKFFERGLKKLGTLRCYSLLRENAVAKVVLQSIISSLGASIAIFPFMINSFGRVATLSVLLNIVAVPIGEMIIILSTVWAMVAVILPIISSGFVVFISALVQGLIWMAGVATDNVINCLLLTKMNVVQVIVYYLLVLFAIYCMKRPSLYYFPQVKKHYLKFSAIVLIWLFGMSCLLTKFTPEVPVMLTAFDVGQGDCTLLTFDNNMNILIDAGEGKTNVEELLLKNGINYLDGVVATHMHSDHIGGFTTFENIEVERLFVPYGTSLEDFAESFMNNTNMVYEVVAGQKYSLGEIEIWIVNPEPEDGVMSMNKTRGEESTDENNRSIVSLVKYHDVEILLCGDAEEEAEKNIVKKYGQAIDCDIIKVGHHGSDTSSSAVFIQAAQPEFGVISVGEDNRYGHPSEEVLERYDVAGTTLFRTDQHGSVKLSLYGDRITTHFHKEYVCR